MTTMLQVLKRHVWSETYYTKDKPFCCSCGVRVDDMEVHIAQELERAGFGESGAPQPEPEAHDDAGAQADALDLAAVGLDALGWGPAAAWIRTQAGVLRGK